ncbi:hypothetical protein UFOVP168_11 [uncultured Caudovirales phage]|uniref:Uncharacterized protein n=1 Tax=uncultured Caudovirales phage TaxID=2100421 RepID=A0A6J7WEA4_9CAUD|nr:hypothetical protein UFOVP168_11 [uncultured Caudovirales phage]
MNEPTTSLRDSLEEVVDQVDTSTPEPAAPSGFEPDLSDIEAPEPASEQAEGRTRDEQGRFAPKAPAAPQEALPQETPAIQPGPKSGPRTEPQERAPVSWRPEVREHWNALPPAVRAEVARRENEVQRTLQETSEARRYVEAINKVVQPYEMFIRAENSNPLQAIDNMMSTAARLRTGTGPETATLIAQLVNQFGVGRFGKQFIETLDGALAGQTPRVDPTQQAVQQAIQQQLAPVQQFMSQFQQAQASQRERVTQEAYGEVQSFLDQAEFGEDVREEMADIIELGQRRGRSVTIQEAYQQACMANPEVRAALQSRARQRGAQASSGAVQRAKAAAVSVTGGPALSAPQAPASADIRSAIESAIVANSR